MREHWTTAAVLSRQNHAVGELTSGLCVGQNPSITPPEVNLNYSELEIPV